MPKIWPNFEVNGLDWQCYLAGSSTWAPRIFIFSIAENLSYMKFIETHACAFLALIILSIGTVMGNNTINNHFWPRHDFKINHQFLYIVFITIQAILDALLKAKALLRIPCKNKFFIIMKNNHMNSLDLVYVQHGLLGRLFACTILDHLFLVSKVWVETPYWTVLY